MTRTLPVLILFLITPMAIAQDVAPLWIVKDEPPRVTHVSSLGAVGRGAVAALGVAGLGALLLYRRRERDPREAAYDTVASSLALDADDRAMIRELGVRAGGVPPVALLLSESALIRELKRARRRPLDPAMRVRLNRVEAKVLGDAVA